MTSEDVTDDIKTRIAWLYHIECMTQDEVARAVGLNRSRVLRILAAARQDGTVQIRVTTRLSRCTALERQLEYRWGLTRAIVIPDLVPTGWTAARIVLAPQDTPIGIETGLMGGLFLSG